MPWLDCRGHFVVGRGGNEEKEHSRREAQKLGRVENFKMFGT